MHQYVYGLPLILFDNAFWIYRGVSYALSLVLLLYVYRSARMLGQSRASGWIAPLLLLALPMYHWLSFSPLSELLAACDEGRFGADNLTPQDKGDLLKRSEDLISRLEKELRR